MASTLLSESSEKVQLMVGVASWIVCSIGMMLFNKLAIHAFPVSVTLVALQMAFTVLAMLTCCWSSIHIGSLWDAVRWSRVVPFFTGMLLTSILALKYAPMSLVVVFRVLSPLVALVIERFYPDPLRVSVLMLASIAVMLGGVILYTTGLDRASYAGIGWVFLNNFFAIGDRLLQRLMLAKDQQPVDISKTGVTLLNNLLGLVPLVVVAFIINEFPQIPGAFHNLDGTGIVWVVASCVVGVLISYSGIWVQAQINATSFLVLVNANKFIIILIECFILATKKLTALQIVGACVTILAGMAYGKARERIEAEEQKALGNEKQKLVQGKV